MKETLEEKCKREIDEIYEKNRINNSDIDFIKKICKSGLPEIKIKNSEKIDFCIKQQEYAKYLFQKLMNQLQGCNLKEDEYDGKMILIADEEDYNHRFTYSTKTPEFIYDKYFNRSNQGKELILNLIKKLQTIYNHFYIETSKQIKGNSGEKTVKKYFSMFSDKYPSRMNVLLPIEDEFAKSSELDSLIVTPKGIFVCEIKNWGDENSTITITNDDTWSISKNGNKENRLQNPFEQNIRHVIALEKFLKQNGISCKVWSLVIMANSKVRISNSSNKAVIKASGVYEYIEKQPLAKTLNEETQNKILDLLDNLDVEENMFPCQNLSAMKGEFEDAIYKAVQLRKTEMKLEKELFDVCEDFIAKGEKKNMTAWYIFLIILAILAVVGLFVFRGVVKFFIGVLLIGIVCGGLES